MQFKRASSLLLQLGNLFTQDCTPKKSLGLWQPSMAKFVGPNSQALMGASCKQACLCNAPALEPAGT